MIAHFFVFNAINNILDFFACVKFDIVVIHE